ncbi:hypothetical protein [Archangium primigenium]|uniref:hypothetical protein n=1 Tax=[Archangium] primigenium TaxID=2792470 RepID=UPI001957D138|nr:hypothetical protein [Archangium primigenium]MBM7117975.1 hypothetical protein [Archangium primigenium]
MSPPDASVEMDAGQPSPDAGVLYQEPVPCSGKPTCVEYEDRTGEAEHGHSCGGQVCPCARRCVRLRVGQHFIPQRQASGTTPSGNTYGFAFNTPGCFTLACDMEVDVVS